MTVLVIYGMFCGTRCWERVACLLREQGVESQTVGLPHVAGCFGGALSGSIDTNVAGTREAWLLSLPKPDAV